MATEKHDWAKIFADQKKSGLSIANYCRKNRIHQNMFYKNRKKQEIGLVEIKKSSNQGLEEVLVITKGIQIRVLPGASPKQLAKVMAAILEGQP
jgi:hypothetical protein